MLETHSDPDDLDTAEVPLNRFQRWYFDSAEAYYQRLPEDLQAHVRALDAFLYSRRALGAWLGAAGGVAGSTLGLWSGGVALGWALLVSLLAVSGLVFGMLAAFLLPDSFSSKLHLLRGAVRVMVSGVLVGVVVVMLQQWAEPAPSGFMPLLLRTLKLVLPLMAGVCLVAFALFWAVARVRREQLQKDLFTARLQQERDAAAREAAEIKLKLLQAQVQPHFIFNTLSAVQHWVDTGDARASPLLRALTAFLRGSAELLDRPLVSLGEEMQLVRSYLQIMSARLGDRLALSLDIDPDCERQPLPPGLLLTLVENALEHGIGPSLRGGQLQVRARRNGRDFELCVIDDGAGLAPDWREGIGLANSRQRLRHQFGERASLRLSGLPAGAQACVRIEGEKARHE